MPWRYFGAEGKPEYKDFLISTILFVLGLIHSLTVIIMDNQEFIQLFISLHDKEYLVFIDKSSTLYITYDYLIFKVLPLGRRH